MQAPDFLTTARYGGRLSGIFLVLIFTRGWVDPRAMVWSEGNMSLKKPVTPPGIGPGTVRLVAQRLNHYATPGPYIEVYIIIYTKVQINACWASLKLQAIKTLSYSTIVIVANILWLYAKPKHVALCKSVVIKLRVVFLTEIFYYLTILSKFFQPIQCYYILKRRQPCVTQVIGSTHFFKTRLYSEQGRQFRNRLLKIGKCTKLLNKL